MLCYNVPNMDSIRTKAGKPMNLGTTVTPKGVYFTVFSRNAKKVFLELYNSAEDAAPYHTVELNPEENRTGDLWHVFVEGLKAGDLYLYRVDGPFTPSRGHRFDKTQSLFDPRAKAFTSGSVFKYMLPGKDKYMERFPKCVIVDDEDYDWEDDKPLAIPLEKSIIYETHLKGFTASPTQKSSIRAHTVVSSKKFLIFSHLEFLPSNFFLFLNSISTKIQMSILAPAHE